MPRQITSQKKYMITIPPEKLRIPKGSVLIELNDEEMLKIGGTNLILGYHDDTRNNSHWFGDVAATRFEGLEKGDTVWFSYLSAKGMPVVSSLNEGKTYIIMEGRYTFARRRDGEFMPINGCILAKQSGRKQHDGIIEFEENNNHIYTLTHTNRDSKYRVGDRVWYWHDYVFELEGQRQLLGDNYCLLREEDIVGVLEGEDLIVSEGWIVVGSKEEQEVSSIILPVKLKQSMPNSGTVIQGPYDLIAREIYFNPGRVYRVPTGYALRESNVLAKRI